MKIYISYDYDERTRIRSVQTLDFYLAKGKTEEETDAAIAENNKKAGWERFRSLVVSDELAAVLRFALGENEYKYHADITDVYNRLKDVKDDLDSMRDDCFHMSEWVDDTIGKVKKLVPEEDQ